MLIREKNPYVCKEVLPCCFQNSLLSFSNSIMGTSVGVFEFALHGICGAFWMCRLIFSIKCRNFLSVIFSNILSTSFPPSSPLWNSYTVYVGITDGASQVFEALLIFLYYFFPSVIQTG